MKNKKVVFLFVIVLLCSSYDVLAQSITEISQKREARYGVEYANYWRNDEVCDTLFLEDGTFSFLLRTPIRYIPGYTALFKEADNLYDSEVVFTTSADHPYMSLNKKQSHSRQFLERHQRTMELGLNKGELREVNEIVPQKTDSLSSLFHEEYRPTCALPEPKAAMGVLMNQKSRQEDSWILGTERAYRELCEQKIIGLCDFDCDTLYLPNGKCFLFSTTPISLKKGFLSLLTPEEFQVSATSQKFGVKGYSVVWTVHNNRLYLQTVHPYANDYAKRVSELELKQRVEKLVGSAFDANGCIFASWVSGDCPTQIHHQNVLIC